MSIFVPPLSLDPYFNFIYSNDVASGYDTFLRYANSGANDLSSSLRSEINTLKASYKALIPSPVPPPNTPLRDGGNYLGFRMAMRISSRIHITPLSSKSNLSIHLTDEKGDELIWSNDIGSQPTNIRSSADNLVNEARRQATEGDLFIIRYFFDKLNKNPTLISDVRPDIIWRFFSIWNAIQLSLAQTVFNAKSKNKKWKRPHEKPYSHPIQYGIEPPPHTTYPSGHAAGAGALAGLIYAIFLATGDGAQADKYIPIAYRIGLVREFANLHWTEDTEAGFLVGFRFTYAVLAMFDKNDLLEDLKWLVAKVCADL